MTPSAAVECLLFVASEPVSVRELATALECAEIGVLEALAQLRADLDLRGSALQVVEIAGGFQLATQPVYVDVVARFLARGSNRLSRPALEALAIVAYRQPVTLPEVESVRGVSSGGVIKTLVERRLVEEVGRKQTVGRPILYGTTADFLHYFGLNCLDDLPMLDTADGSEPTTASIQP